MFENHQSIDLKQCWSNFSYLTFDYNYRVERILLNGPKIPKIGYEFMFLY